MLKVLQGDRSSETELGTEEKTTSIIIKARKSSYPPYIRRLDALRTAHTYSIITQNMKKPCNVLKTCIKNILIW